MSVKVAYWAEATVVGRVPASVFVPKPNVESGCCSGSGGARAPAVDPMLVIGADRLFALVRAGFAPQAQDAPAITRR